MLKSPRDAAKSILIGMKHHYQSLQSIVLANEQEFTHLDLDAYKQYKSQLEEYNFQHISDFEILEVTNAPNTVIARTFIRVMVSSDNAIAFGYYQIKPRLWRMTKNLIQGLLNFRFIAAPQFFLNFLKTKHCCDFETEFSDGTFITTSNAHTAGKIAMPASIDATHLPYKTPIEEVFTLHNNKIKAKIQSTPHLTWVPIRNYEDYLAMQARLKELKNAYRATVNWVTKAELEGLGADSELADAVFIEVQNLLKEQSKA